MLGLKAIAVILVIGAIAPSQATPSLALVKGALGGLSGGGGGGHKGGGGGGDHKGGGGGGGGGLGGLGGGLGGLGGGDGDDKDDDDDDDDSDGGGGGGGGGSKGEGGGGGGGGGLGGLLGGGGGKGEDGGGGGGGGLGGLLGGGGGGSKGEGGGGGLGGLLGGGLLGKGSALGDLLGNLLTDKKTGILKGLKYLLKDLLKLKIPATIDDVSKIIYNLSIGLKKFLNKILPGLGTGVYKILSGVAYIVLCNLGSQGLTGKLLGDQPGSAVPNAPKICHGGWDKDIGLGKGTKCDDAKRVIREGSEECSGYLQKAIHAKKKSDEGLLKIVFGILRKLLGIGKKCSKDDHEVDAGDFTNCMGEVTKFYGACGNHYGKDKEGTSFIDALFKLLGKLLGKHGYDADKYKKEISGCEKGPGLYD